MSNIIAGIKRYKIILKIVVACLLLLFVFKGIDFSSLFAILGKADLLVLGLAFLLAIFNQILISNMKWSIILKAYDTAISFKRLCDIYLIGMFFNMFLPGAYGGDVVRAYQISRHTEKAVEGVVSVFLERITGVIGLLLLVLIALLIVDNSMVTNSLRIWGVVLILVFFAALPLLFLKGFMERISSLFYLAGARIGSALKDGYASIYRIRDKGIVLPVALLSVLFQFLVIVTNYMIAVSLNVKVPFSYMMLAIPIISILAMVPVTLNGIGVRDISYIGFLGAIGVTKESAFSIGFIAFLMGVLMSMYGGLVYMRGK